MSWLGLSITVKVMIGTSLLGCVSGVVGSFAVLRRRALVGDMLAHASLPGLCLAFLVAGSFYPQYARHFAVLTIGAFVTGLLGVALMTAVCRWTRTKEDAAIGIVLSTFFGAGIVLLSLIQGTSLPGKAGLNNLLLGKAAAMLNADIIMLLVVSLVSLAVMVLLYKELMAFSFDAEFMQAQGWPGLLIDFVMMGALTIVTIAGLPVVGVVLMAAMIIIPGAAARFWTERLPIMLLLSAAIGSLMGLCGTFISARASLPTGPVIVLFGTGLFLVSMLAAPRRGVAARACGEWALRRKTAREHLLRSLYEQSELGLPTLPVVSREALLEDRAWSTARLNRLLRQAEHRDQVEVTPGGARLTSDGLHEAALLTRRHRLWELYLIERANIAPDHVDRDADDVEHFLSPAIIAQLEARLAELGRLPGDWPADAPPNSPHELMRPGAATEADHA
jgi:manganese/zinc/iron transport system permease protein